MKTKTPRHDRDRIARRELKRSPAFRAELARAWRVEKLPSSCRKTLDDAYEKLPPELIVRKRPFRSALHGLAGLAAACGAVCVILLGINAVEPRLMESLPGLGGAFQSWNDEFLPQEENSAPPESGWESSASSAVPETGFAELPVEDNGTILQSVDQYGKMLTVTAQVPYMGRQTFYVLNSIDLERFGTFAMLTLPDGGRLAPDDCYYSEKESEFDENGLRVVNAPCLEGPVQVTWTFQGLDSSQIDGAVLTLYESGLWWSNSAFTQDSYWPDLGRRVTAEFTLSAAGKQEARPSENYRKKGLRKITPEECLATDRNCFSYGNGWRGAYVNVVSLSAARGRNPGEYDSYYKVEVFSQEPGWNALALHCYFGDDLVASLYNTDYTEHGVDTFLDENIGDASWYGTDAGYWTEWDTDPSRTGQSYHRVVFAVPAVLYGIEDGYDNAVAVLNSGKLRFALADAESGEILVGNADESCKVWSDQCLSYWNSLCQPEKPASSDAEAAPLPVESSVSSAFSDEAGPSSVAEETDG